jgi:hypothetical protein
VAKLAHQKRGKPRPWRSLHRVTSIGQGAVDTGDTLPRTGKKRGPARPLPFGSEGDVALDEEYPGT